MDETRATDAITLAEVAVTSSQPRKLSLTIDHLWLITPIFALAYKLFRYPLPLLDFWWHLKIGEVIATTRSIPRVDLFSFTAAGKPFVAQNWLAELIFYATYRLGGLPLIVFLTALMGLCAFLLVYKLCVDATNKIKIAFLLGLFAVTGNYTLARPQAFSFLLFAAYYFILVRYRTRRRDQLWQLPVLMLLWVNLHGAFVMGLGLIVIFIAAESCRRFIVPNRQDALTWNEIQKLVVVLLLCTAATLLNPETYKIYDYVRTVVSNPASQQFVTEWQPPRVNQLPAIAVFYGPWFAGLLIFLYARVKPDLTETTLFFAFSVFALMSIRNAAWFGTVAFPILARCLSTFDVPQVLVLRRFRLADRLFQWLERPNFEPDGRGRLNILIACVAAMILLAQSPWIRPGLYKASLLDKNTPVGAMDFMKKQGLTGRTFHPQIFGDYLIWRLWPTQKSFIDGRVHLFDLEFVRESTILLHDSHWEELLRRWDIRYLLLSKATEDDAELRAVEQIRQSSHWTNRYEDEVAILFEKVQ